MTLERGGRRLALCAGPSVGPVTGVVHVESRAPRAARSGLPRGPRPPGLRRLHLLVLARRAAAGVAIATLAVTAACGAEAEDARASAAPAAGDRQVAAPVDDFRPGFDPSDEAALALARHLDASIGAARPTVAAPDLAACGLGRDIAFPTELLAAYEITGRSTRGDTVVVRAAVVTAAEHAVDRRSPGRYVGTVRERRGEWEWDVVRGADGWRVCAGPTFGLHAPDSLTTWRPAGASAASATALAARIARRGPGRDARAADPDGGQ